MNAFKIVSPTFTLGEHSAVSALLFQHRAWIAAAVASSCSAGGVPDARPRSRVTLESGGTMRAFAVARGVPLRRYGVAGQAAELLSERDRGDGRTQAASRHRRPAARSPALAISKPLSASPGPDP